MANNDANAKHELSLNRQVILDEDEYTAALSHIIARDFFPSLVRLDATNEYLDAVRTRDPHIIAASVRRLEQVSNTPLPSSSSRRTAPAQTPGRTPYASFPSDTPLHENFEETDEGEERASKRPRYDALLSLDEFQTRYTSEDNSSFTQILDEENKKRREKYGWAWEAQKKVEAQRERMIEARERMLIEPAGGAIPGVREKFRIETPTPAGLITATGENEKGREKTTDGEDEKKADGGKESDMAVVVKATSVEEATAAVMRPRKDQRSAGVDGWKFKTRNSLMFSPDADVSPYHPPHRTNAASDKKQEPKIISHGNTRLVEQEHKTNSSGLSEPPSPTRSRIDAAISGTPYRPKSPSLTNINALVPNLPNPTPEQLGPEAVKQLMTWGTLNATPRILSRPENEDVAEPSTPFHIREMSSREALSRKLANSASKSLKAKAEMMGMRTPGIPRGKAKGTMGPPTWTPRRAEAAGNLTPAARRLLERSTLGTAAAKRVEAAGPGQERDLNRVRWTPTPTSGRRVG
ncbi:hypothetical protein AN958_04921 [Leucoagaricus sp. SymC.cos]|nr:hypothetical protein AN958_04921 [Leucoagaricus sp. SymC.cos]